MTTEKSGSQSRQYPVVHLVVDMQKRYLKNLPPEDSVDLVEDIGDFTEKTSDDIRTVYIRTVDEDMFMAEGEELSGYSCVFNRKASDLSLEKIHSSPFKYGRNFFIAMEDTAINRKLQDLGAKTVLISGLYEDLCVWETAKDAATLGYDVVILKNLCRNAKNMSVESSRFKELAQARLIEEAQARQDFMAAHSNIRYGHSGEFMDAGPKYRAAPQSDAALTV